MEIQNAIEILSCIKSEIERTHGAARDVDALNMALQSMERDIKMEADGFYMPNGFYGTCTKCGRAIVRVNYCPKCGQAIQIPKRKKENDARSTNDSEEQNHCRNDES